MSIRITTLGAVQVDRGDSILTALPAQRIRGALLVFLAINRQATRDRLLALFWGERSEDRARHALSQTVYELRRTLGEDWVEIRGEQLTVAPHVTVDVPAFEEAVERGDFTMALTLYRGSFLEGFYLAEPAWESWVDSIRLRCQRHHRRARRETLTRLLEQARLREALAVAREWVNLDPTDDEAQHRLIELLATMGDRAGALRQFEAYEKLLAPDDLTPLDETRALYDRIRGGDVGALPDGATITPASRSIVPPPPAPPRDGPSPEPASGSQSRPPVPVQPATPAPPAEPRRPRLRRYVTPALAAAAVIALILLGTSLVRDRAPRSGTAVAAPHRVAILYFDDHSPPPGASHLAASFTESLIDELGNQPLLTVRSRQAVARFRGREVPLDSVARALDVNAVVTGSVVVADGQVRVAVELVDPTTGEQRMSRTVQRPEGQYLALLDELIDAVAMMLRQQLGRAFEWQRYRAGTRSDAAWVTFSRGAEQYEQALLDGHSAGPDDLRLLFNRADSLLAEAERLDRNWADPPLLRGWIAEKRAVLESGAGRYASTQAWLDSAVHHAENALRRPGGRARALELRGTARFRFAGWAGPVADSIVPLRRLAVRDLQDAVEADPTRAHAHSLLATFQHQLGDWTAARLAASEAERLDPFAANASENNSTFAMSEFELGRERAALDRCMKGVRRFRDVRSAYCALSVLAWADTLQVRPDDVWTTLDSAGSHAVGGNRTLLEMLAAAALLRAGDTATARRLLEDAAPRANTPASPWIEAAVRYRLGETERALNMLEQHLDRPEVAATINIQNRALRPLAHQLGLIPLRTER